MTPPDDDGGNARLRSARAAATHAQPGLCSSCSHARRIETARGGTFWLCAKATDDPGYPRYPRLPVLACPGHAAGRPA